MSEYIFVTNIFEYSNIFVTLWFPQIYALFCRILSRQTFTHFFESSETEGDTLTTKSINKFFILRLNSSIHICVALDLYFSLFVFVFLDGRREHKLKGRRSHIYEF